MSNRKQATHRAMIVPPYDVKSVNAHLFVTFNIVLFSREGAIVTLENRPDFRQTAALFNFDDSPAEIAAKMIDRTVAVVNSDGAGIIIDRDDVIGPRFM